jgi:hypothetical protein
MLLLLSASRNSQTGDSLAEGGEGRGERRGRGVGRDKEAALNMQGQSDATLAFSLAHTRPPSEIDATKLQRRGGERERGGGGGEEKERESVYEAYESFWREQTEREVGGALSLTERESQTLQLECRGDGDGRAAEGDKFEGGGGQIGGDLCAVVWLPGFNDAEVTGASVEILQRVCVCVFFFV